MSVLHGWDADAAPSKERPERSFGRDSSAAAAGKLPIIEPLKPQFENLDSKDPEIVEIHAPKRLPALNPRG